MSRAVLETNLDIKFSFIFYQFNSSTPEPYREGNLGQDRENVVAKETLNPLDEFIQAEKLENKPIFSQESTLAAAGCENIIQFEERCGSWSHY